MSKLEKIKKEIRHLEAVKSCFRMAGETSDPTFVKTCYKLSTLKAEYKKLLKERC